MSVSGRAGGPAEGTPQTPFAMSFGFTGASFLGLPPTFSWASGALAEAMEEVWSRIFGRIFVPLLDIDVAVRVFPDATAWLRPFERARRVEAAFKHADLLPAPSMGVELVEEVVEAYEEGAEPEELCRKVVDHYDAHDAAALRSVVERLCSSPHFAGRELILRQTFEAHRAGLDAITVYPLVPMIEGVLSPYLSDLAGEEVKSKRMAEALEQLPVLGVGVEGMACLIGFVEARLYEKWEPGNDPRVLGEYVTLNRHRLAHGGRMLGTRIDALRCFLALELVTSLLDAWDELQQE